MSTTGSGSVVGTDGSVVGRDFREREVSFGSTNVVVKLDEKHPPPARDYSSPRKTDVVVTESSECLVFLGTGASCGVPMVNHLIFGGWNENNPGTERDPCKVCQDAWKNPLSKNRRGNIS
eukprot:Trichotokara_eunicae@DN7779_c0_g1_i1.p1